MQQPRQWLRVPVFYLTRLLMWLSFGLFFRVQVTGHERLPRTGGVLVISNHISWFDPTLLSMVLTRAPNWLAMMELFTPGFWRWFFLQIGMIPIDRNVPGSAPLKEALKRLRSGHVLVMFPEGGIRTPPKSVLGGDPEVKAGASLVALKAHVPIVPAIIEGARWAYDYRNWFFRKKDIYLALGEPFTLPLDCDREQATTIMREHLLAVATEVKKKVSHS